MKNQRIFICRQEIANANIKKGKSNIVVAIPGSWKGHYMGDYELTAADLDSMVANFEREGRDVLFDFDHECFYGSSRASGWGKSLSLEDNKLVAEVEWTKAGLEAIENKEYRYLSNVFIFNYEDDNNPALRGTYLHSVALTNVPFQKELPEILANSLRIKNATGGVEKMNELLKLLGVSSEQDAIAKINSERKSLSDIQSEHANSIQKIDTLEKEIAELKANSEKLIEENQTLTNAAVENEVDLLIANGTITPAFRDTAIFLRKTNKDEFDTFVKNTTHVPKKKLDPKKNNKTDDESDPYDSVIVIT